MPSLRLLTEVIFHIAVACLLAWFTLSLFYPEILTSEQFTILTVGVFDPKTLIALAKFIRILKDTILYTVRLAWKMVTFILFLPENVLAFIINLVRDLHH